MASPVTLSLGGEGGIPTVLKNNQQHDIPPSHPAKEKIRLANFRYKQRPSQFVKTLASYVGYSFSPPHLSRRLV